LIGVRSDVISCRMPSGHVPCAIHTAMACKPAWIKRHVVIIAAAFHTQHGERL
jgi:hypothetical protein